MITIPTYMFAILVITSCGLTGGLIGTIILKLLIKIKEKK